MLNNLLIVTTKAELTVVFGEEKTEHILLYDFLAVELTNQVFRSRSKAQNRPLPILLPPDYGEKLDRLRLRHRIREAKPVSCPTHNDIPACIFHISHVVIIPPLITI